MPVSGYEAIPSHMSRVVAELRPVWGSSQEPFNILDLGVGTGQWGFLFRNYLDYAHGRIVPGAHKMRLTGVEGFEAYRNPGWEFYDEVIIGEIRQVIMSGRLDQRWRLVNMIEVLEHFDREEGAAVLGWISDHSDHMLFSFYNGEQGAAFENELERHRGKWSIGELQDLLPGAEIVCGDDRGAYLWRSNPCQKFPSGARTEAGTAIHATILNARRARMRARLVSLFGDRNTTRLVNVARRIARNRPLAGSMAERLLAFWRLNRPNPVSGR